MALKTVIRKIGNSRGLILPAAVLEEVGAVDEMFLSVQQGRIVLEPAFEPRRDWFKGAKPLTKREKSEQLDWDEADLNETSEWKWE